MSHGNKEERERERGGEIDIGEEQRAICKRTKKGASQYLLIFY